MGCLSSKPNTVPSVPTPERPQPPQPQPQPREPTSIPRGTTSTPPQRHGTSTSERPRAKSQSAASTPRRHIDGGDYPPPSSEGDVFTSQHPDRPEMPSRQYPSRETGRTRRNRSVSMVNPTALPSTPLQSFSRRKRTASTARGQLTAGRQGGRSRFPFSLQSLLANDFRYAVRPRIMRHYYYSTIVRRFRILVVGKVSVVYHTGRRLDMHIPSQRDCGKSSLMRAIFKADMSVCTLGRLWISASPTYAPCKLQ